MKESPRVRGLYHALDWFVEESIFHRIPGWLIARSRLTVLRGMNG
jgi:hypothetical protein